MSVSSIKPVINHIHTDALSEKDDDISLAKDIKCHICTDLDSRYLDAKQKHLGCKKGEANQKQQLSDYKSIHSYTCD